MSQITEVEYAVMLMEIGQKVVNSIAAGAIVGHTSVRGQKHYVHSDDPAVRLVMAYGSGDLAAAREALTALYDHAPALNAALDGEVAA